MYPTRHITLNINTTHSSVRSYFKFSFNFSATRSRTHSNMESSEATSLLCVCIELGMMIYNRHAQELAKGRALSPILDSTGQGGQGTTNVASTSVRHTTTTTRDTSDATQATSPSFLRGRLFHSCMHLYASVARPPAHLARRAGVRLPPCNSACPGRQLI